MNRIILQEEKAQVSHSFEVLGSRTGIPKDLKKMENSRGEEGLTILEFRGHGGNEDFRISEGKRGVKILMPPVVGYGYFLESPIHDRMLLGLYLNSVETQGIFSIA